MEEKMLKFINIGQQSPKKRNTVERKEDFNEIYKEYVQEKYIYSHEWEDGDLFIMNQTVCIHRRANASGDVKIEYEKLENRLLNRIEFTI